MNKKYPLKPFFSVCVLILLSLYISADENQSTDLTNVIEDLPVQTEENVNIQENNSPIIEEIEINLEEIEENQNINVENSTSDILNVNDSYPEIVNPNISSYEVITEEENKSNDTIQNTTSPQPEGSSSSESKKEIYYVNIENISAEEISLEEEREDTCSLQSPGKRIEIKNCENVDILSIKLEENKKDEFEKEVIISSKEHVNQTVTINTSLTTESKKEDVHIYWKNENNLEITSIDEFSVKYYDENNNGLIDTISWEVPHLSEQIFDIVVEITSTEIGDLIELLVTTETEINPINFNVDVRYNNLTKINCSLEINKSSNRVLFRYFNVSTEHQTIGAPNLENGAYNWEIICSDKTDSIIFKNFIGNFEVKEEFDISLNEGKVYLLDLTNNSIRNSESVTISSTSISNFSIKLIRNGQIIPIKNCSNSCIIALNETLLNSYGLYNLSVEFNKPSPNTLIIKNFSVASVNLVLNDTSIEEGESVRINVLINSPIKKISPVFLEYGDGTSDFNITEMTQFSKEVTKKYSKNGSYTLNLSTSIVGLGTYQVKKSIIITESTDEDTDNDAPTITIINPEDEEIVHSSAVNFSYKVKDNSGVGIKNCSFKLYNANNKTAGISKGTFITSNNTIKSLLPGNYSTKTIKVDLIQFEDGFYWWDVECFDNHLHKGSKLGQTFEIRINKTSSNAAPSIYSEELTEIEELKDQTDVFLTTDFSLEEQEVLEDLNILNDTKYYKKRLLDIEYFFKENYKYVSSETLKEKKIDEYTKELKNIKNQIPQKVTIEDDYEYIKNSVDADFEVIIKGYLDSTNTQLSSSSIKKLIKINKEIQNEISVSAIVRNVKIEYINGTRELALVKKKITLNDKLYTKILEIIPKELTEDNKIVFLTKNEAIDNENIFELDYNDLNEEKIVYYIDSFVRLNNFEGTETLLFEENLNRFNPSGITGFSILNPSDSEFIIYFILAILLLVIIIFVVPFISRKIKMLNWRKEPNVEKVMNLIADIQRLLKEKEIESSKEKYYKIKEIYPLLPSSTKKYFYKKMKEISTTIDRKDILELVKEFQNTKKKWNKENYIKLYQDIKKVYYRLPEKDRKKVHAILYAY